MSVVSTCGKTIEVKACMKCNAEPAIVSEEAMHRVICLKCSLSTKPLPSMKAAVILWNLGFAGLVSDVGEFALGVGT